MASIIVNRGLQVIGGRASNTADAFTEILSMAVDDRAVSITATDTALGSPTNVFAKAFDATPTRSSQTITHITTFAISEGNFDWKRITLHNAAAGSVNGTSTTLVAAVDNQSLTKNSDFSIQVTLKIQYTSA